MNIVGWMIILAAVLIYAGIAGLFAWAGYMRTGLAVFNVGLLVLFILTKRGIHAQPPEFVGAALHYDGNRELLSSEPS